MASSSSKQNYNIINNEEKELHVVMVAFSAQGHINPLFRLANTLLSKNLHVTLATTESLYHRMYPSAAASSAVPASITVNGVQVLFFSDGYNSEDDRNNAGIDGYIVNIEKFGPGSFSNLLKHHFLEAEASKRIRLACIINNPFVPWAADVAAEAGIPCACLWIQPCALFAIYFYRFGNNHDVNDQFLPLENENDDVVLELPGFPALRVQDLPSFVLPWNLNGSISKMLSELFENMKGKLRWVLANSFYELEKEIIDSLAHLCPILPVGPLVPSSLLAHDDVHDKDHNNKKDEKQDVGLNMWKAEDSCMEWLSNKLESSVIYISFGSLLIPSNKEIESITRALRNTKRHFLWVLKLPEISSFSSSDVQLPLGLQEETLDQGLIVSWCPQTKVLSHPSIACFLTHCGWNSMLEALTVGTPMIAYPKWTDQPTNAKLLSDVFQTGVRLQQDNEGFVESKELERAIEEVAGGGPRSQEIRENAQRLKQAAREAVASGGSSDQNVQLFVDEIIASLA